MKLFVDLDGVLADFDGHYFAEFGVRLNRNGEEPTDMWGNIRGHSPFTWFDDLPLIPGATAFWQALQPYQPVILSGIDQRKLPGGEVQKRRWVDRHFGPDVTLLTCRSRHKCRFASRGDILVDDWAKYRELWENVGGIFVLHRSFAESLAVVQELMAVQA
jgi:5'-nucleotidase